MAVTHEQSLAKTVQHRLCAISEERVVKMKHQRNYLPLSTAVFEVDLMIVVGPPQRGPPRGSYRKELMPLQMVTLIGTV